MPEKLKRKLNMLREKYSHDRDSLYIVDKQEEELRKLIEQKEIVEIPIFKAIFKDAENRLNEINTLLMNDKDMNQETRTNLFAQKEVWKFIFSRFGVTAQDTAIQSLISMIDSQIEQ